MSESSDVRFTALDVEAFARASHDLNPLHLDAEHARRSPFGRPIVHGSLGVLALLAPLRMAHAGRIARLHVELRKPAFTEVDYAVQVTPGPDHTLVELLDGRVPLVRVQAWDRAPDLLAPRPPLTPAPIAIELPRSAHVCSPEELFAGQALEGWHTCDTQAVQALHARWQCAAPGEASIVRALLLCSFVLGMRRPGRDALFSSARLWFDGLACAPAAATHYTLTQTLYQADYGLLGLDLVAQTESGAAFGGALRTLVRRALPAKATQPRASAMVSLVAPAGRKVALITGGSRGLGAELVTVLVRRGWQVMCAFQRGHDDAAQLEARLAGAPGRVLLAPGDLRVRAQAEHVAQRLRSECGRLDLLICNACAPPDYLDVAPATAERMHAYVSDNLALTSWPLVACLGLLAESAGTACLVSSQHVERPPEGLPHYVALKQAAEGLFASAARAHREVGFSVVRPPRLLTDMNNLPGLALGAASPEAFAAALVDALARRPAAGEVGLLGELLGQPPAPSAACELPMQTADARTAANDQPTPRLVLAATFTADPLLPVLERWSQRLSWPFSAQLAPYGQLLPQLLAPDSLLRGDAQARVLLVRMADAVRTLLPLRGKPKQPPAPADCARLLDQHVADLLAALREYSQAQPGFTLVLLCPEGPGVHERWLFERLRAAEQALASALRGWSNLECWPASAWHAAYAVGEYADELRDALAHIPYRAEYFEVLGTLIVRRLHALWRRVDSDVVIWACDDDATRAAASSEVPGTREAGLLGCWERGAVLALVSDQSEQASWARLSGDSRLTPAHVAAARWEVGPERAGAVAALADELGVSLERCLYLDSNPTRCAALRDARPELPVICWPRDERERERSLARLFTLDHLRWEQARDNMPATASERVRAALWRELAAECEGSAGVVATAAQSAPVRADVADAALLERLTDIFARTLGLPVEDLAPEQSFERLGIGSFQNVELMVALDSAFGDLPPTLLFEQRSLLGLARWLAARTARATTAELPVPAPASTLARAEHASERAPRPTARRDAIAIVGLQARLPGAPDAATFWQNLQAGRVSLGPVPEGRWDVQRWFDPGRSRPGTIYSNRGGFLENVRRFDAAFFGITPREAALMDPQQRLLLEVVWGAIEDAGHTRASLGRETGVFVGVIAADYGVLASDPGLAEAVRYRNSDFYQLANRISYHFDLHGPSVAVDTACSSSGTALHLACESLARNECERAVVGGVNLFLHPSRLVQYAQMQLPAPDGVCRPFGAGAEGTVFGEGIVALVLRPLEDAQREGDHVYGVILGSAINAGGKTNGFTVPDPTAQAEVITRALSCAGVSARSIGYVEAHGTGTALGDPIEIRGLTLAFERDAPGVEAERQFCALGSVKASIGHLESAAGLAGLVKVLLQLQHGQLVPSLHALPPNPRIAFEHTPFRVQAQAAPWPRPEPLAGQPRRAGLSTFGAGGANAHFVIEEAPLSPEPPLAAAPSGWLFPLSAQDDAGLRRRAAQLADFCATRGHVPAWLEQTEAGFLARVAYTLQVGREPMPTRTAIVAASVTELVAALQHCAELGHAQLGDAQTEPLAPQELCEALASRDLARLAQSFRAGQVIDWPALYDAPRPRRLPLPSYPFAGEEHWLPAAEPRGLPQRRLHALVDRNVSTLAGTCFFKELHAHEPWVAEHVIGGRHLLAGTAYVEMGRVAGVLGASRPVAALRDVVFTRALELTSASQGLEIALTRRGDGARFEIRPVGASEGAYAAGDLLFDAAAPAGEAASSVLDLAALAERCRDAWTTEGCYGRLADAGIAYGPSFRVVTALAHGHDEALACLDLGLNADLEGWGLHPLLLDAAFQVAVTLLGGRATPWLPFQIRAVDIRAPLTSPGRLHVRLRPGSGLQSASFDATFTDMAGHVAVRLRECVLRSQPSVVQDVAHSTRAYTSTWRVARTRAGAHPRGLLLAFVNAAEARGGLAATRASEVIQVRAGAAYRRLGAHDFELRPDALADYRALLHDLRAAGSFPRHVMQSWLCTQDDPTERQRFGLESVFCLSRALSDERLDEGLELLVGYGRQPGAPSPALEAALSGLARTLVQENPKLAWRTVELESDARGIDLERQVLEVLACELGQGAGECEVRYVAGQRELRAWDECRDVLPTSHIERRTGGVYLISGGAGGLGLLFAEHLWRSRGGRVVLLGRRDHSEPLERALAALRERAVPVEYLRCDVSVWADVCAAVAHCRRTYGRLDGVIHAAGIVRDRLLRNKELDELRAVVASKVLGARHLDAATAQDELEFFVTFGSSSGLLGNVGQCDYAYANAYLWAQAHEREQLRQQGQRRGRSLCLAWPLWAAGGMQVDADTRTRLYERHGMVPMPAEQGLEIFDRLLAQAAPALLVFHGSTTRLWASLDRRAPLDPAPVAEVPFEDSKHSAAWRPRVEDLLIATLAEETGLAAERIAPTGEFDKLGLDSLMVMRMTTRLEERFGNLSKTLFFEHRSVRELATYFCREHAARLAQLFVSGAPADAAAAPVSSAAHSDTIAAKPVSTRRVTGTPRGDLAEDEAIAIVGLAGRYPQAADLRAFWAQLVAGRDCITEIPVERWDANAYFNPDPDAPGGTYSKWGGFLDDVDKFDPLFFGIAPREAELMDPQERLFLQCAWHTVEDAGYTRAGLAGQRTGVFVGVMWGEYQLFGAERMLRGQRISASSSYASIANRVSYVFDFRGPSLAVDTMCSASLTALHLACESLRHGECELALAGGVNVSIHPNKYLQLSQGRFAASDGRCRSFGARGDGYVPGEGVGAALLKPLARARADGDHVYGLIRSTSVNHGGRMHGYTVPNPNAQAELVSAALARAGVDARSIGYVEAHGTGTALGDPIEIAGLAKAYRAHTTERQFCAIGSVKSNIGHLESAAGIAGLTKVLLQLQHRTLVPSLHAEPPNPNIDFASSPFYVQRELAPWPAMEALGADGQRHELPRRAGLSSFGAGGSNAHLVVEEYVPPSTPSLQATSAQLVPLSARSDAQLRDYAASLLRQLTHGPTAPSAAPAARAELADSVRDVCAQLLGVPVAALERAPSFTELGLGPLERATLAATLSERWQVALSVALIERCATLDALTAWLVDNRRDAPADTPTPVETSAWASPALADVAFTLQAGREAQPQRVAFVVQSLDALCAGLRAFVGGASEGAGWWSGRADDTSPGALLEGDEGLAFAQALARAGKLERLARLWVAGVELPWETLMPRVARRRVALPTYPFARRRCWIPEPEPGASAARPEPPKAADVADAHPVTAPRAAQASTPKTVSTVLRTTWRPAPAPVAPARVAQGTWLVLVNVETRALAEPLATRLGLTDVVVMAGAAQPADAADGPWRLDVTQPEQGQQLIQELRAQGRACVGLIDLSDLATSTPASFDGSPAKLALVQALLRATETSALTLLHVTRHLELFAVEGSGCLAGADFAGLVAMLGSEYGRVLARSIDIDGQLDDVESLARCLRGELSMDERSPRVCWRAGRRYVPALEPLSAPAANGLALDAAGVYVVTGGLRGLGAEVADRLVARGARRLVLMGRDALPARATWAKQLAQADPHSVLAGKLRRLLALIERGIEVEVHTGPLTDRNALATLFAEVQRRWGRIAGVVHCAGRVTHQPPRLVDKTWKQIAAVYEPKIAALQVLHDVLATYAPDFFVTFSSLAAVSPRLALGLSDYANANAFMDHFVAHAARRGARGWLSIAWPSWREVGMGEVKGWVYQQLGLGALSTNDGLALFEHMLAAPEIPNQVVLTHDGRGGLLEALMAPPATSSTRRADDGVGAPDGQLGVAALRWLTSEFARELHVAPEELDAKARFEDLGLDSVMLGRLVRTLEARLQIVVEPSWFFEHPTLERLAAQFGREHGVRLRAVLDAHEVSEVGQAGAHTADALQVEAVTSPNLPRVSSGSLVDTLGSAATRSGKVAVIGMACHLPGARDMAAYWDLLRAGRSAIVEVPATRWDVDAFYAREHRPGKTVGKWGGFLERIEWFDADYFGLRAEVAAHLDPLLRQYLEVAAETWADAGYGREELAGQRVGVFVGARSANYAEGIGQPLPDSIVGIGQNFIAAHVSHFYDLRGPNLVVDSACSSSLVSVHLACQSVLTGESDMALAGGVEILLDERPYLILSEARALSPDGQCRAFDEAANGLVPGEGCGAVLLKSLERALADGDRIHAVIEGTAVNNDGRTMGITTPNQEAQKDVVRQALQRAGVDARALGYVEAHGTGTLIGDPIELRALTQVYRESTSDSGYCAVGSVKSNLGHLLSAAGIAGLLKALACVQHGWLVPTLNCVRPNPRFRFAESPFQPSLSARAWSTEAGVLRRAGVSAFGFGGTNAHAIVAQAPSSAPRRSARPAPRFQRRYHWVPRSQPRTTRALTGSVAPSPAQLVFEKVG
jgi:acyl transferase domain-containing protein/acyl carrier protein/short-subunit dehydrogenase involved in D-alanine esterification of teichoic acids